MAQYERGVYEPPSDDIEVFDGGDDDIDEEGSRLPLLIVIALVVLAAFGGVVWLAYTQGVQRGRTDAPRIIAAAPGPDKTAPADGGGATAQYQGLKIYDQPAPPDDQLADEDSAPPPPTQVKPAPELRPQQMPDPAETKTAQAGPPTIATAPPRSLSPPPAPVKAQPAVPKAVATPAPAPVAIATSAPPAPITTGSMMLQIGAYKSADDANAAWKSYEAKHPIAGGYSPDVKQVDLGEKGTWYRLRIGPFDGKAAASAFCQKLTADGAACFLAAP